MRDDEPHGQFAALIGKLDGVSVRKPNETTIDRLAVPHERHRHRVAVAGNERTVVSVTGREVLEPVGLQVHRVDEDHFLVLDDACVDDCGHESPGVLGHPPVDGGSPGGAVGRVDGLDASAVMGGGGVHEPGPHREVVVGEQPVGDLQGGGRGGSGQREVDCVGGAVQTCLGEPEDLIERRPGAGRCAGPGETEGGADADRA